MKIEHFFINSNIAIHIEFKDQSILNKVYKYSDETVAFTRCGNDVGDCVIDAYGSNRGWASVAFYFANAINAPLAVGLTTAACIGKNCF